MKILLLFVMMLSSAAPALAAPATKAAALMRLARARVEAAEKHSALVKLRYQHGVASLTEYIESRLLCFQAVRDSPILGPEREKAAQDYRDWTAQLLEQVRRKVEQANLSGEDLAAAEYRLAEADYWLEEARGSSP